MIVAITENGTPASSIRVQPVCRRSWNRHETAARIFADSHASFQRPIGLVGSLSPQTAKPSDWSAEETVRRTIGLSSTIRTVHANVAPRFGDRSLRGAFDRVRRARSGNPEKWISGKRVSPELSSLIWKPKGLFASRLNAVTWPPKPQ
jgi:hypothetical protein